MSETPSSMLELNTSAPTFNLPDFNGKYYSIEKYRGEPLLVIFLCNHCPFVKHVISKLANLVKDYQSKGINVVGINANDIEKYPEDACDRSPPPWRTRLSEEPSRGVSRFSCRRRCSSQSKSKPPSRPFWCQPSRRLLHRRDSRP